MFWYVSRLRRAKSMWPEGPELVVMGRGVVIVQYYQKKHTTRLVSSPSILCFPSYVGVGDDDDVWWWLIVVIVVILFKNNQLAKGKKRK